MYNQDNHIDDINNVKSGWFYNAKLIRTISSLLLSLTFIYSLTWLTVYIIRLPYFVITNFNIYTNGIDINLNIIQEQLSKRKYSFFSLSLDDIRSSFEELPSIKNANIIRKYPNSIDVILEKQNPFAKWGQQDDLYINSDGLIYTGSNYDELRTSINLYGQYNDAEIVLKQYHELQRIIKYKILSLNYSTERNWIVILSNSAKNISISNSNSNEQQTLKLTLGKEDNIVLEKKLKFWQKNWNILKTKPEYADVNVFDLRHNGFTMKINNSDNNKNIAQQNVKQEQTSEDIQINDDMPSDAN
jgi:cell division protein FtsQ